MTARQRDSWSAQTHIGRVRTHNEDSVLAQPPLYVVADGLGGHEAGEVASSIAIETVRDHAPKHADAKALARAVRAANREVIRAAKEGVGRAGMGTTITAAMVEGGRIALAQVGDSRAYLLHEGTLEQLTQDHSMVADMVRDGTLTAKEARYHPNRSVITRALGTDLNMEADTFEYTAATGDRLLLCSDGLSGMLEDARITELLGAYRDPDVTAKALVEAANEAGGQDNVSVIVVDIEGVARDVDRERRSSARAIIGVLAWVLAFVLVVAGIGYGVYRYALTRYFLIAENGVVVVYRGVPGEIAGYSLAWEVTRTETPVSGLPASIQQRLVDGVVADDLDAALQTAADYRKLADPAAEETSAPSQQEAPGLDETP